MAMTDPKDPPDIDDPGAYEAPTILDRGRHRISRRDIDPDCLKVLYRLNASGYTGYLVGGAVRDLLLGRKPADFDIGTNAHPNQIKKLFRNAFLIGRRFRLAHVRFQGGKIIEVATCRRKPSEEELAAEREEEAERAREAERAAEAGEGPREEGQDGEQPTSGSDVLEGPPDPGEARPDEPAAGAPPANAEGSPGAPRSPRRRGRPPIKPIAYGTPREDAFRRDLTINALFYDIATYSVIDYVGGLDDLAARRVRIIGDPDTSYTEDPVRIWRVLRHSSRLGFTIEERTAAAIGRHRDALAACPGARLYEELNKDIKSGGARAFFQSARAHGVLSRFLGDVGAVYEASDERAERAAALLGVLDASIASGGSPPAEVMYALLLWPWAEPLLAGIDGDRPKALYEAFRAAKASATVPKTVLLETAHTLVIADHMVRALADGQMRWALRERPRYPEASRLTSVLVDGSFGSCEDPFALIYQRLFGQRPRSKPHRYRRRRKPGTPGSSGPPAPPPPSAPPSS
jgi:poly(A) polymerase